MFTTWCRNSCSTTVPSDGPIQPMLQEVCAVAASCVVAVLQSVLRCNFVPSWRGKTGKLPAHWRDVTKTSFENLFGIPCLFCKVTTETRCPRPRGKDSGCVLNNARTNEDSMRTVMPRPRLAISFPVTTRHCVMWSKSSGHCSVLPHCGPGTTMPPKLESIPVDILECS